MTDTADRDTIESPIAAHRELAEALLAADEPALQRLIADDCQIIGPKGFHISKPEWIGPHTAEVYQLESLDVLDTTQAVHGGTAVIVDRQRSACVFQGERISGSFRVMSVWRREPGGWLLAGLQYTSVADAATP